MIQKQLPYALLLAAATFSACGTDSAEQVAERVDARIVLKNHSATPALLKTKSGFEGVQVYSLIGSDDQLAASPSFRFGGSADGTGLVPNADGKGYTMLVNHEDNFSVSRITFDETFKPVKGEYLLNSDGGKWRLCSATMATPEVHGFGPLYLTCGESGAESRTHGINPFDTPANAAQSRELMALGRWSAENALPLPKEAYSGKTAILIGDDDSGANGGQVALYLADKTGDLNGGKLYMMRRKDQVQYETQMTTGNRYEVEFVEIKNHAELTGAQMNMAVEQLSAIRFGRVEDLDFRKGGGANGREIYFNVTGQNNTGYNVDNTRTKYGRVYKLVMDATNPLKGQLEVVLDGDDRKGKAGSFQNVDNICVTENYAYIQEDPNGYGDETHDSYIYQYDLKSGALKVVCELDHRRQAADAAKYNVGSISKFGDWEYGALIDISATIGSPNTFALCIQPHTWTNDLYKGIDGGSLRPNEKQASQIVILKGLPR